MDEKMTSLIASQKDPATKDVLSHATDHNLLIDNDAGIDVWYIDDGITGIASRVQWVDPDAKIRPVDSYDSFTTRLWRSSENTTEFPKRLSAIADDKLYPKYTIQAYVHEETRALLSAAVVKTIDLMRFIERFLPAAEKRYNEHSRLNGNLFIRDVFEKNGQQSRMICAEWSTMREHGVPVAVWYPEGILDWNSSRVSRDEQELQPHPKEDE